MRAHLILESQVEELLELLAPNPAALADMQLDFFGKVKLLDVFSIAAPPD